MVESEDASAYDGDITEGRLSGGNARHVQTASRSVASPAKNLEHERIAECGAGASRLQLPILVAAVTGE